MDCTNCLKAETARDQGKKFDTVWCSRKRKFMQISSHNICTAFEAKEKRKKA